MNERVERLTLRNEHDVVVARQRARTIATVVGFDTQDQARIATAVSEIARNAVRYAHGGRIEFALEGSHACSALAIRIGDDGPGIEDLASILDGSYRSPHGMGLGIAGARRLMDRCEIASDARGTRVEMAKALAHGYGPPMHESLARVRRALANAPVSNTSDELLLQQRELLVALAETRDRQEQLAHLERELEDTNRGVVALYAELDEKAARLRQADEMKSRFLSNMSHEFRTPLSSIRALAGLLLGRVDGPLTEEQAHQVRLIAKAANDLAELVDDLLDIARIEAGKLEIVNVEFTVDALFSTLRGMLRPLVSHDVALKFVPAHDVPPLVSDEGKVAQILRNLISNALKYTERGSVTVAARRHPDIVEFVVEDTGIGIAPEDHERIFEEFVQVRGPLQTRVKGTGLGLPLCRRLAHALGGHVAVDSRLGHGSRFFLTLPVAPETASERIGASPDTVPAQSTGTRVLVVEDDPGATYAMRRLLESGAFHVHSVRTGEAGIESARTLKPDAIVLDLGLPDIDGFALIERLRGAPSTRDIPLVVCTSRTLDDVERAHLGDVVHAVLAKDEMSRALVQSVRAAIARRPAFRSEAA
jgi:signal transduction histidine kinase/ActR/RegA family two-component response regulator